MAHQSTFNCVHETCQQACDNDLPFGGKSVIILGDFRQTCPVVRGGSRSETIEASIKSSSLWSRFTHAQLTVPIRHASDLAYADFVDAVGNGAGPLIDVSYFNTVQNAHDLLDFTFPPDILSNPAACVN